MKDRAAELKKDNKDSIGGFRKVVLDPKALNRLAEKTGNSTEAAPAPEGLRVYWDTLYAYKGWKLQKNYYFSHCRILDEYGCQKASGGNVEMLSALKTVADME